MNMLILKMELKMMIMRIKITQNSKIKIKNKYRILPTVILLKQNIKHILIIFKNKSKKTKNGKNQQSKQTEIT